MRLTDTGRLVLGRQFQQPDQRSCGAAVAVMAEALANDGYARRLLAGGDEKFYREVSAMHRRVTGPVDAAGAIQAPWLRVIGTPPWALTRQLGRHSNPRRVVAARLRPARAWAAMNTSLSRGELVPAYVGSRWLPRHVVLAIEPLEDAVRIYEPGAGRVVRVPREEWIEGRLLLGGWREPWCVVSAR